MKTMFSGNQKKKVPGSFEECYKPDIVSTNLWVWGERMEKLGKILFISLIICGIILSITTSISTVQIEKGIYTTTETNFSFQTFISILITYAFYAFIEYCAYHVIALIICSLASIVQNNRITANIALFNSAKAEGITTDETNDDDDETYDDLAIQNKINQPEQTTNIVGIITVIAIGVLLGIIVILLSH